MFLLTWGYGFFFDFCIYIFTNFIITFAINFVLKIDQIVI